MECSLTMTCSQLQTADNSHNLQDVQCNNKCVNVLSHKETDDNKFRKYFYFNIYSPHFYCLYIMAYTQFSTSMSLNCELDS